MNEAASAWADLVRSLDDAGRRLEAATAGLDEFERADAYRALVRALNNQLSRFEVDRDRPELVPFNGWRERFFMDNPDFRYWVADLDADGAYRLRGCRGRAAYVSITAYAARGEVSSSATSRIDSDALSFDDDGTYEVLIGGEDPGPGSDWIPLPDGATALWVRHFHDDARPDHDAWCEIEAIDPPPPGPPVDPDRFAHRLRRLGQAVEFVPGAWEAAVATESGRENQVRHWSEMTGGAVFTEPGIHYLRGAWSLEGGEALVIEGDVAPCRYWNVLLYSRFLNSLDFRARTVSATAATATVVDGRYRFVLAAEEPPPGSGDWLDTEGRQFGIFVFRWLQPDSEPTLPTVTRCQLDAIGPR